MFQTVVFVKFRIPGSTVSLETKNAQSGTNSFENILKTSKRKPNLLGTDAGSEFVKELFINPLKNNNNKKTV